ncbi:MAG: fumarylacetoacetate hydrolase family protein [Eubacteriales bacterium]|nr:fumarylacetoacetate hydrolase family protein [Eubacteriales bacterium]
MRFVTFQRVIKNDSGADGINPVLEYGLPVTSEDGSIVRPAVLQTMEETGLLSADGTHILPLARTGFSFPDMNTLIAESTPEMLQEIGRIAAAFEVFVKNKQLKEEAEKGGDADPVEAGQEAGSDPSLRVGADAKLLSPIPCPLQDVICLGLNYTEHAEEAAAYSSESFTSKDRYPVYFSKRVFRSPGDEDPVPAYEGLVDSLDYEAELAVIIGCDVKGITPEEVPGCIFGYTILNDFSARNLQTRHTQWYLGKSLDGYTPMGPCIVTADEFSFPPRLAIRSTVNGELRQDSTTDMLIFGIDRIISELSAAMTLRAGTIISTGTPRGVGMGFDPPRFLQKGDTVTCEIEGIGTLTNIVGE